MSIIKVLLGWLTGPFTKVANIYIEGKNKEALRQIELAEKRVFLRHEMQQHLLEDSNKADQLVSQMIREERGDWKTSWIRPVTALIAIVFWSALCLSQMVWVGWSSSSALLPIIWNVPPALLGQAFLAFPMGVLATFYLVRPFEKHMIGK